MDNDLRSSIEAACTRLLVQYARGIDLYDADMVLGVFTEDATWQRPGNPLLEGREEIRSFLVGRDRTVLTRHVMTNLLLDSVDADHATGVSYYTGYNADGYGDIGTAPTRAPFSMGEYLDRFRRTDIGWRIAHRETRHVFHGSD